MTIEDKIESERCFKVGWAIINMTKWERFLWSIGFGHKYLGTKFWDTPETPSLFDRFRRVMNNA